MFALPRWGEIPTSYAASSTPARVADLAESHRRVLAVLAYLRSS